MSLGNQEAPRSILASGTSFREDLVMKLFLFKKSRCQLMAKECVLSIGYLPRGGLPMNSVDRITDYPDMTSAVDRGRKASTQTNKKYNTLKYVYIYSRSQQQDLMRYSLILHLLSPMSSGEFLGYMIIK